MVPDDKEVHVEEADKKMQDDNAHAAEAGPAKKRQKSALTGYFQYFSKPAEEEDKSNGDDGGAALVAEAEDSIDGDNFEDASA